MLFSATFGTFSGITADVLAAESSGEIVAQNTDGVLAERGSKSFVPPKPQAPANEEGNAGPGSEKKSVDTANKGGAAKAAEPTTPAAPEQTPAAPAAPETTIKTEAEKEKEDDRPSIGVLLDAGIPDGAQFALAYRPWYFLRAHAGMGYNVISPGFRGGISLIPFDFVITPVLTGEWGTFLEGDAKSILESISGETLNAPALQKFSYTYLNAHIGFEVGSPYFAFYLKGGLSHLSTSSVGLEPKFQEFAEGIGLTFNDQGGFSGWVPSAKLGFAIYFL